jgi:hypothetical protein
MEPSAYVTLCLAAQKNLFLKTSFTNMFPFFLLFGSLAKNKIVFWLFGEVVKPLFDCYIPCIKPT